MQGFVGSDACDQHIRIGIDRFLGNVRIPRIVGRKELAAIEGRRCFGRVHRPEHSEHALDAMSVVPRDNQRGETDEACRKAHKRGDAVATGDPVNRSWHRPAP